MTVATQISDGIYNARFAGVPWDGLSDAAAKLQTLFTSAGDGAHIRVPPGTYLISSATPALRSGQTLDLTGATLKFPTDTSLTGLLDIDNVTDVTIVGGVFDGNVANQAVWSEFRHSLRVRDSSRIKIKDAIFTGTIGDAVYISHGTGGAPYTGSAGVEVTGCSFIGTNVNRNGVSIICGRRIRVHHNDFYRMARADMPGAIDLEPDLSAEFLYDVVVDHNTIDNGAGAVVAVTGIQFANSNAGADVDGILIEGNVIRGDLLRGIRLIGHASVVERGVVVQGNIVRDITPATGQNYGVRTDNIQADVSGNTVDGVTGVGIYQIASDLQMIGNTIRNCTVAGFEQGGTTDVGHYAHNKVRDCAVGFALRSSNCDYESNDISAASGMAYGILFNTGTETGNRLARNRVSGATTANFGGTATPSQTLTDNIGYVTEASGTGSIASGTTSATVTHGLAETPPSTSIRITLLENPTADPGNIWVDTIGATTFKVNCRNNPGASNLDFAWYAEAD